MPCIGHALIFDLCKKSCKLLINTIQYNMIKSFKHKGLKDFFESGNKAGIVTHHAKKLQILLTALNVAKDERDMNAPSWQLHSLSGNLREHWSVSVSGNWRVTFRFDEGDVELVDYQDYH